VGSWAHVPQSPGDAFRTAYAEMVAAMERAGMPTGGLPPVWAWGGRCGVTIQDAHMLVGEPLWHGYATVEFAAPAELALASDYGVWNDYLFALFDDSGSVPCGWDVPTPVADERACERINVTAPARSASDELVQVCLPALRAEWVREVRPLPRSPDDVTDWEARA
jgi:hypothetical protein